jgi:putative ABC transport system permease protein
MAPNATVTPLLLILLAVGAVTLGLAVRHRLALRIAMRNVRRGRARTVLLIAGLLVGTTIVSGSLVVGDTVQQLVYHYSYLGAGYVDEAISAPSPSGGLAYFPYSVFTQVNSTVTGHQGIVEVTPEIVDAASVYDERTGIPETSLNLIGVNANQSASLGSFVADNGSAIAGPAPNRVLIDDQTAAALNATVGDTLVVVGQNSTPLVVQAVVQENVRGAFITGGLTPGNVFVDLAAAQQLERAAGKINYLAITNTGSQAAGAASSTSVSTYLNSTLAGVLNAQQLTVSTPLQTALDQARQSGQSTMTIFLVLGLFSIVAGAMLIVGIFVMLAEERKGEMGMLRAIGMRRSELVYTYFFEGVAYAAGSAAAGTLLGVVVGYFLVYLTGFVLAAEGIPPGALVQSFAVTNGSLLLAYVVGFLLTLVTVVVACRRASRLNIVRAIRDVPEPPPPVRTYTFLAYLGGVLLVGGLLGFLGTYRGSTDLTWPLTTGAMAIVGVGLVAARFLKNRPVFTAVGVALVVWAGWEPLHAYLLGASHTGGIFIVFVEGITLVVGMLLIFLFNATVVAEVLRRVLGRRSDASPVVRIGLGYPTRRPTRTIVSLAIFALVVFTMVATAGVGSTIQGNLNSAIATESGGYSFFAVSQTPISDLWGQIQNNSTLQPLFSDAVAMVAGTVDVSVPGFAANPYTDRLYAPLTNQSGAASFFATNQFTFQTTSQGRSASQTFAELATNDTVAVVDSSYAPLVTLSGGSTSGAHPTVAVGDRIELVSLRGSQRTNVTVIGILRESAISGVWVNPTVAAGLGYTNETAYFLSVTSGTSTTHAAQEAKRAFFSVGLVLFDLRALIATSIATTEGFIGLLEVFVGLGLSVGIAAMGIVALRAVVERRRETGVLRAAGFTRSRVLKAFVLEYSFVTLLGVAIGVTLGLLIVYNLSISPYATDSGIATFVAPWVTVAEIAGIAYGLVLVAIALPSLRAARLPPAEAVRATE